MTDGLIWVGGSTFDSNNAVGGGGGILLDPSCAMQVGAIINNIPARLALHVMSLPSTWQYLREGHGRLHDLACRQGVLHSSSHQRRSICHGRSMHPAAPVGSVLVCCPVAWVCVRGNKTAVQTSLDERGAVSVQGGRPCLFAELDASTFVNNHAGAAGGAVGSTSVVLPVELRFASPLSDARRQGALRSESRQRMEDP